ncbi:MAG: hypothetical protein OXN97_04105, partial [Bryobacterales bacterium]|nr:hypothetical protein [Bryobacterales bacterium]
MRAFDATTVQEPGRTGSLWRMHHSVNLPSLGCDFFKLTAAKGGGSGESFTQFPIRPGNYVLADRGYSTAVGIQHVVAAGGHVPVIKSTGIKPQPQSNFKKKQPPTKNRIRGVAFVV